MAGERDHNFRESTEGLLFGGSMDCKSIKPHTIAQALILPVAFEMCEGDWDRGS